MQLVCSKFGTEADVVDQVKALESDSPEQLRKDLTSRDFVRSGVEYCAGWTALQDLTATYRAEMSSLAKDVTEFVSEHPSEKVARDLTTKLAKDLGLEVDKAQDAAVNNAKRIAAVNKVIKDNNPAVGGQLVIS